MIAYFEHDMVLSGVEPVRLKPAPAFYPRMADEAVTLQAISVPDFHWFRARKATIL